MKLNKPSNTRSRTVILRDAKQAFDGSDIKSFAGSPDAKVMLLTPVPTDVEREQGSPWCDHSCTEFFSILSGSGVSPSDFIFVPASFYAKPEGKAPSKKELIHAHAVFDIMQPLVERFVCIGPAPYKAFFGRGKCHDVGMMSWKVMKSPDHGHREMMFLPPMAALNFPVVSKQRKYPTGADFYRAKEAYAALIEQLVNQAPRIAAFVKGTK